MSNFLQEAFVETPGVKYNTPVQPGDKRMTTERCAYLYAVCLANNKNLCWSGMFPINWICYIGLYYPNIKKLWVKFQQFLLLFSSHMSPLRFFLFSFFPIIRQRMEYVKKFSNLNIFLSHFIHKIADNCWNEALEQNPRWTHQQRQHESRLERLNCFVFSHPFILCGCLADRCGVCLFMHAWVAFSLIFY